MGNEFLFASALIKLLSNYKQAGKQTELTIASNLGMRSEMVEGGSGDSGSVCL